MAEFLFGFLLGFGVGGFVCCLSFYFNGYGED
jgi:hypothetical protein